MEPQIRYCTSADGTYIAYATAGLGFPLVIAPVWTGDLASEWNHPEGQTFFESLAQKRMVVQHDLRGVASSQREVDDLSLEAQVSDIAAVADHLHLGKFDLLGGADAAPSAIAYAALNPERVSRLILWSPYSSGEEINTPEAWQSLVGLIRNNWKMACRVVADIVFPSGPTEFQRRLSNRLRQSISPETAAKHFERINTADIRAYLPRLKVPTLVFHRKNDRSIPLSAGRAVAASIPNARFIALEGDQAYWYCGDISFLETANQFLDGLEVVVPTPEASSEKGIIGKAISHYRILEKLGEGGMGVVYKAEDTKLERTVALKFLPPHTLESDEEKIRFVREAKAAAALDHPNICTVHEIDEAEGQTFIAMAYIDGKSLQSRIESGPLDVNEALSISIQLAEGLRKAHRRGIIHRDIKSANIMIDEDGQARILDFGLAKLTGKTRLTKTATIMGTVAYMSPEQAHGESAIDHHTDIWSLGVLMYEMLAGKLPFDAPSDAGLIYKIIHEKPEPLSGVPVVLEQAIKKAMQKDPRKRYEDMGALIADLKSIRSGVAPRIELREKATPSIAVLPFADMSPQKDQEYFCDGISESLINALTQLRDLRVIARTSAFSFKGQNLDVREIGKTLNVGTVLEGSIQKAGDRVRVTAQLINTARGEHLWSEKYDRDMEDIFAIQDEISQAIVDKLKPALLGKEETRVSERQRPGPEAYNLFLQGRWFWNKQSEQGVRKAIEYFEQVIEKAPDYALAYVGLADCYSDLPSFSYLPPKEFLSKARSAILKAMEIDDTLAEAYTVLAKIKILYEWDWENAESEIKRAIELNPGYALAHRWYAGFLQSQERMDEAISEMEQALELDPISVSINRQHGGLLVSAGQYNRGIESLRKVLEMDPNCPHAHMNLGYAYFAQSKYEEAVAEFKKEREISKGFDPFAESIIGVTAALMGKREEAQRVFGDMLERSKVRYVPPFFLATLSFALGDNNQGFDWLEKAHEDRDLWLLVGIKMLPRHLTNINLSSDPRYIAMLKKMGLEKSGATVPIVEQSPSIAVLPFVNMSADPEQEYFCDGLAEELINALTQIKDLKVIARTSAFSFRGKEMDVRDIGKKLDVGAVLEGSVRKAGDRLRITAQLVDTSQGHHLWSDRYDRKMDDVFAIQDEITVAIVEKLKPRLLDEQEARLASRQTMDIEAYNLCLKGRYFWKKHSEDGFRKAIEYFKQAIELDPNCAMAYVGLADSHFFLPFYGLSTREEVYPKLREATLKALEIDHTLADAHCALGDIKTFYEWDWVGGESAYKKAIELSPGLASAHNGSAVLLQCLGRSDEALNEMRQALELDPLSILINRDLGMILALGGRHDEAIDALTKTIEMDPNASGVHNFLGFAYLSKSMYKEALNEFKKESDISKGQSPHAESYAGLTYALMGKKDDTQAILDNLLRRSVQEFIPAVAPAFLYLALGEKEKGFEWLEKGYEERDPSLCFLKTHPVFQFLNLRSDPRYIALLKKMNLDK